MLLPTCLPLVFLSAVSVSPGSVPANGRQTALVTVDRPSMVHLSAQSGAGTACEVVDKVRGPFAHDGTAGRRNCAVDLLLDSGTYKLRLDSAHRGKGTVQLSARAFTDINPAPVRLQPRALVQTTLKAGQQASYWLSLDGRGAPNVRISGRTAGEVKLWRAGEWVEEVAIDHQQYSPEPGRPIHEWWVGSTLEAGDYLLTVYGTGANQWPGGKENDALELEYGFRDGPAERATSFVLGPSGVVAVQTPRYGDMAALLSLDGAPQSLTQLQIANIGYTPAASCSIEKKALVPQCSAWSAIAPSSSPRVLLVRGPAGTRGLLEWMPQGSNQYRGGYYGAAATRAMVWPTPGPQLLTVHDLPIDTDAAPLGCFLTEGGRVIASDFPTIDRDQKLDAQFNYDSAGGQVWFKLVRGGRYRVEAAGERKSHCELFALQPNGELTRVSQSQPNATACQLSLTLAPGLYQLGLYEGLTGVEHLTVQEEGAKNPRAIASKSSCLLPSFSPAGSSDELQLNRTGALAARGVLTAALPLQLDAPLHLTLDPGLKLELPLAANVTAQVRSAGGAAFGCGLGEATARRDGQCAVAAGASGGTLRLENSGPTTVGVTAFRSGPQAAPSAPQAFSPAIKPLPVAKADAPQYFDFDRGQSHSLVFDVDQPGLYHVTTLGLLSTSCSLRTPVIANVASDTGTGRGRNCLVAGYLRPGRYMLTVSAQGQSLGRAGVVLTRRPLKEQAAVAPEGDSFFRVEANDLVQQRVSLKRGGRFELATTAQGASGALGCRLDDSDGWPVLEVPTHCTLTRTFAPGNYLWTQLPLTVESMRHTSLKLEKTPAVLKGNKPHQVEFFTWYQASLGRDGKDEFLFKLEGPTELDVVLTKGMQGRLFLLEPDKQPKPVDLIPPTESTQAPEGDGMMDADGEAEQPPVEQGEGMGEGYEGGEGAEAGDGEYQPPPTPLVEPVQAEQAPAPPSGHLVKLQAGSYRLVTEHSRGDVAVDYQLHLGSAVLMPGMTRLLPTPSRLAVKVPRDGTLRVRTRGDSDVRCRFFDSAGALVFEGSDNGPDWNCSLAEPVLKGDYTLVLESETQSRAQSELSVSLASIEDKGPIVEGATVKLGASVQVLSVPLAEKDAVQEASFKSKAPFSCALEGPGGRLLTRRTRVTDCSLLVRPQGELYRVRLWTTDGAAQLTTSYRSHPLRPFGKQQVPAGEASLATIASAGRYRTSPALFCLPGNERGLLKRCGPEVSLEAGPVVFAGFGAQALTVPLEELTIAGASTAATLSRRPFLQALAANEPSVFLLEAAVQHGERAAPSCAFDGQGTVREGRDAECYAASGVGTRAIERLWAPVDDDAPVAAATRARAVKVPAKAEALPPGRRRLSWTGEAALYQLPAGARARVDLTLPADAWAVLLDGSGAAVDLCAPGKALTRCALTAKGSRLLLVGAAELLADATTVVLDAPERTVAFTGLYEDVPRTPGSVKLKVSAADAPRVATIEGARRCTVALSDGVRIAGCRAQIPAGLTAELLIEHGLEALRAMVHQPGRETYARLGIDLPMVAGPPLPAATAIPLTAARTDRTLVLEKDSVVRVTAEAGVCGLFRGNDLLAVDGLAAGCEVVRVLPPGTYRVLARPFANAPVPGALKWTAEPVLTLGDGVGPEEWLAPGEVRLYRFSTGSKGQVGLGLQSRAESLDCAVYDDGYRPLGEGCQQYLSLDKGSYLLTVRLPATPGAQPLRFKPVLLGLAGAKADVPQAYLEDFFRRTGVTP